MIGLTKKQVLSIYKLLVEKTGGSAGINNEPLLDSAINNIWQTFGGMELYPTLEEKGARLGYSLVSNHPFRDGNKRLGVLTMLTFFAINQLELIYNDDEIVELGIALASGTMDYTSLLDWIKKHSFSKY